MALTVMLPPTTVPASAASGDRTLYLHHTHTGETGRFTFKRNGRYDQKVLRELNVFLADWRTKEPTKMDPALFDLIWEVYQEVGATQPVNIVSAYRSPKTNADLRKKSNGVAENSRHIKGQAMDFFIPGVQLATLRASAMRHQVGGVGYYPTSGSPFVHLDTGNVRAWPRMTRAQLKKVFPDGKTLHLPTDGKPLSSDGTRWAQAQWQKCHQVPCNGQAVTAFASNEEVPVPAAPRKTLVDVLFGGGQEEAAASTQVASNEPAHRAVPTVANAAPLPQARPAFLAGETAVAALPFGADPSNPLAPVPAQKSPALMLATRTPLPGEAGETAVAALAEIGAPVPAARALMTPKPEMVTAYVPSIEPDPEAQRALQMIIERETTASLPALKPQPAQPQAQPEAIQTASLETAEQPFDPLKGLMDLTWNAVSKASVDIAMGNALQALVAPQEPAGGIGTKDVGLVAPDIDHVAETMVQPVVFSDAHFAELYDVEGYLDPEAELGALATRMDFAPEPVVPVRYDRFVTGAPLLVAAR